MADKEHIKSVDDLVKRDRAYSSVNAELPSEDAEGESLMSQDAMHYSKIGLAAILGSIALIGAGVYGLGSLNSAEHKNKNSSLEQYAAFPVTNVVAQSGDTMDGLILKYCPDSKFSKESKRYTFMLENGNNGQITAGTSYKVHVRK